MGVACIPPRHCSPLAVWADVRTVCRAPASIREIAQCFCDFSPKRWCNVRTFSDISGTRSRARKQVADLLADWTAFGSRAISVVKERAERKTTLSIYHGALRVFARIFSGNLAGTSKTQTSFLFSCKSRCTGWQLVNRATCAGSKYIPLFLSTPSRMRADSSLPRPPARFSYARPRRGPWVNLIDVQGFEWNTVELTIADLPTELDGGSTLQIADLHLRTRADPACRLIGLSSG